MTIFDVLNQIETALAGITLTLGAEDITIGVDDVQIVDYADVDADGVLKIAAPRRYLLIPLVDNPEFGWGQLKYTTETLQVAAFSTDPGEALEMVDAAQTALLALNAGYIPLKPGRIRLGKNNTHTGYARRFQKGR